MSANSKIEWTDATWNPVRGCTKISAGCTHCYAETFAERFRGVPRHPFEQGFDLRIVPEKLADPLQWKAPKVIFVNSMSDLSHPRDSRRLHCRCQPGDGDGVSGIHSRFSPNVQTRMAELLKTKLLFAAQQQHIWWGVSVENIKHGVPRISHLQSAPAKNAISLD